MNRLETLKEIFFLLSDLKIENEIIVFDQNSTDGSVEFLKKQKTSKVFFSDKNIGNSISRNNMINNCNFDYVLLLDSDIIPIKNSIESLYYFMKQNPEFSFVGYDFENCTDDKNFVTKMESEIKKEDIETNIRIALTQYGMFRKRDLIECPFPELPPFNIEGWGAEDDMVGMAINDNKLGITGKIKGRTYYHNHPKSSWQYINDEVERLYALRYIIYKYFDLFLTPLQKKEALKTNKLPKTKLNFAKYFWKIGNNFGDVATDYVWKKYFPFFEFDDKSDNLLFFGGTIIDHYQNAKKEFNKEFSKILMFGVGIVDDNVNIPNIKFEIYPRGHTTYNKLKSYDIPTNNPVGDVLQLFSLLPTTTNNNKVNKNIIIEDVFSNIQIKEDGKKYRICNFNFSKSTTPFLNFENFLNSVNDFENIISSQIHPYYYYLSLGKSCNLIVKDSRASDLKFFKSIKFNSNVSDSVITRKEMQKNIPIFVETLFKKLKKY